MTTTTLEAQQLLEQMALADLKLEVEEIERAGSFKSRLKSTETSQISETPRTTQTSQTSQMPPMLQTSWAPQAPQTPQTSQTSQTAFRRGELKYVLDEEAYHAFRSATRKYLVPDNFACTQVNSLYLDTVDNKMIRRSIEKPAYKEKLRLRTYDACPTSNSLCFLEIKKKLKGTVFKRRVSMTLREAQEFLVDHTYPLKALAVLPTSKRESAVQVLKEIEWLQEQYGELSPGFLVSYKRLSLKASETNSLRITFDRNLCWSYERNCQVRGYEKRHLIDPGMRIMEIKSTAGLPLWLVDVLNEQEIYPHSFSKVGNSFKAWLQDTKLN